MDDEQVDDGNDCVSFIECFGAILFIAAFLGFLAGKMQ